MRVRLLLGPLSVLALAAMFGGPEARTWSILPEGAGDAPTIQAGIDSAEAGDTVLVACGTYHEYDIAMKSGICVRSAGTDPACAVIDAGDQGRVMSFANVDSTGRLEGVTLTRGLVSPSKTTERKGGAIEMTASCPRLARCVVRGNRSGSGGGGLFLSELSRPRLERVTISDNWSGGNGGGILCESGSAPILDACSLFCNTSVFAGAAIYSTYSSPLLDSCVVAHNVASGGGGGFYSDQFTSAVIQNTRFENNRASTGGGIHVFWGKPTIRGCLFSGNYASSGGSGVKLDFEADLLLDACVFVDNTSESGGGALVLEESVPSVTSCRFEGNTGANGGGANLYDSRPVFQGCVFSGNGAANGGGVYLRRDSNARFVSCRFEENSATQGGGAYVCLGSLPEFIGCVFQKNSASSGGGGYVTGSACQPSFGDCTFNRNTSQAGGSALWCYDSFPAFRKCILAFGEGCSVYISGIANPVFDCSDIYGNAGGDWIGVFADRLGVLGNMSENPLFCNGESGDVALAAASPCLSPACGRMGAVGQGCDVVTSVAAGESGGTGERVISVFPNPSRGSFTVRYSSSFHQAPSIAVFDIAGRLVRVLDASGAQGAALWDGRDGRGGRVPPGMYFVRFSGHDFAETRRVILLR